MAFSVKATLVAWQGDPVKYPCHAMLKIGDVVSFDGANFKGMFCADAMPRLTDVMYKVYNAGPRYVDPSHFGLYWYAPISTEDEDRKRYDGNGWVNKLEGYEEPAHHISSLLPPEAFKWPPAKGRPVMKVPAVQCPDLRTAGIFVIEAFDLATAGNTLPYTRRQMVIMDKVIKAGGSYSLSKIYDLYTDFEINEIYPPLVDEILYPCVEELELLGFATISDGSITITEKGRDRVARYREEIPAEDASALGMN